MIVRHVIEHANNLSEFIHNINLLVDPSGYIVWELPDCERSLNEGDCTTIWEEHIHYFTSTTFKELLHNSGFSIIDFESVSYPLENSIIALVNNSNSIEKVIKQDRGAADEGANRAYQFAQKITQRKKNIRFILEESKKKYGRITMFGAGHFSVAFISIMEIEDLIDFVIDDNPNKKGLIMPVGGLEIKSSDSLYNQNVGLCLLGLNPQNQPLVLTKHKQFIKNGGKFTSIFPGTDNYLEKII